MQFGNIYLHYSFWQTATCFTCFLADRTNGRAIATLLHLSSSVCDVMYCG